MKPLTTSVYTFSDLIEGGYLYVDKTAGIHRLVAEAKGQYFLARPRRFGKSLLVSTLKAIFHGRRELFQGLAIDSLPYGWQPHPVIHLDLGSCQADTREELERSLSYRLDDCAKEHGLVLSRQGCAERFRELVDSLSNAGKVVILVDEYDKPLLGHLGQPESARLSQAVLKSFYSVIKTTESRQRFALLTGVSKFSKVSVFSDLNNLTDLTQRRDCATLLGYTQAELEGSFPEYVERLAAREGQDRETILEWLALWYNGYRFEGTAETVYNPVSVMKCLDEEKFGNYWFETGTPTFLVDLLRKDPVNLADLTVPAEAFSTYDVANLSPLPLLVQTGYLTITDVQRIGPVSRYHLAFPNREVEQSFSAWLAQGFCDVAPEDVSNWQWRMIQALQEGDVGEMLDQFRSFLAGVPYTITLENEKYYQTIFFVVFKLIGAAVHAEVTTNVGRIDAVVETPGRVYLFEFKLHGSAEEALAQMRSRRYPEKYLGQGREVVLVGVAFDAEKRNLGESLIEAAL